MLLELIQLNKNSFKMSLCRNKWFMLYEMTYINDSKFAVLLKYGNPCSSFFFILWLIICNNKFKTNLFNVRHSTKSKTSKLSVHNSWQPHFIHMYFNMEVLPMPAGAWTVITVGKDGPGHGIDQHFPNISSIRTDSTAPRNLNKNSVKSNFRFRNQ